MNTFKASNTLIAAQAKSETLGLSLSEPLAFIQQALNMIADYKYRDGGLWSKATVDVTIYLGIGDHFFFSCHEGQ